MTQVLNIDEFKKKTPLSVVVGGKTHHMQPSTVQTFLDNLEDMEALAKAPSIKDEIHLTVRMIVRAFPTLTEEEVRQWPLYSIEEVFNTVRGGGATSAEVIEKDASGNQQPEE